MFENMHSNKWLSENQDKLHLTSFVDLHANETCDVLKDTLPAHSTDLPLNDHNQLGLDRTYEHHCRPNSKYTRALESVYRRPI